MLFIQTLLCLKGYDNGRRFLAINSVAYTLILISQSILLQAPVLLVLLLLITTPVLIATGLRRVRDSVFPIWLGVTPLLAYWLSVAALILITHWTAYLFFILSIAAVTAIALLSNAKVKRSREYHLGYNGPVLIKFEQQKQKESQVFNRIEPTLVANEKLVNTASLEAVDSQLRTNSKLASTQQEITRPVAAKQHSQSGAKDAHDSWSVWLANNKPMATMLAGLVIFAVLACSLLLFLPSQPDQTTPIVEQNQNLTPLKTRNHKIAMPDNFWIMLDQFQGVTIAWQGDLTKDGQYWSAYTAEGDRSCFQLRFNNGSSYRVLQVEVKNQGDYYADFSPMDTRALIEGIAKNSRFSLCGFSFSLKGTQAELMSNKAYFDIISQE